MTKLKNINKGGYVTTLPFLALCFFFLILSVVGLVFAYILKDNGQKDVAVQSVLSSGSIMLDFAKLQSSSQPMYVIMSDSNYFFAVDKKPERDLFEKSFGLGTKNCYETQWYLPNSNGKLDLLVSPTGSSKPDSNLCPSMGAASVVLLPHERVILRLPNIESSPISGVSIR